jgi:fructosamine-3-kinase
VNFWRRPRQGFQLELAARNGLGRDIQHLGERLMEAFPTLMDHAPSPSLLHGDLWGGNLGHDDQGNPVIYDPATYYGDREAEIAMTELFGGFGAAFYDAYNAAWPLDAGYRTRRTFYNLYHILNHANMFGGGYVGQARRMMEQLLAALG